jgi:hypothetical protein
MVTSLPNTKYTDLHIKQCACVVLPSDEQEVDIDRFMHYTLYSLLATRQTGLKKEEDFIL